MRVGIVRQEGQTHLTLASAGDETTGPALTGSSVELRAEVSEDQMVRYSYSLDGRAFQPFGDAIALARFSWWKGSRPGLFTFTRGKPDGSIDVDWVRVDHPAPAAP